MFRSAISLAGLLLSLSLTAAREGYVRTQTGEIYEGHLRFASNSAVVVNAAQDLWVQVALSNVVELVFLRPMPEPFSAAAGQNSGGWLIEGLASAGWARRVEPIVHRRQWFTPELELRSGSRQRGFPTALDDAAVYLDGRPPRLPISRSSVANIRFQPLPPGAGTLLNSGRRGVLLRNGEFIDGECRRLEAGRLVLSSVPLGICRYDLKTEVVVAVLRERGLPVRHPYQIVTADGSIWVGLDVSLDSDGVRLREPTLGFRRFAWHEVMEFHRRG